HMETQNYKPVATVLKVEEKQRLLDLRKRMGLSIADILRLGIQAAEIELQRRQQAVKSGSGRTK
ncbi:MAG: hypothetical protein WD645_03420, partial [Dehalococcoidia bacterium]